MKSITNIPLIRTALLALCGLNLNAEIIITSTWDDGTPQGWILGSDARGTYELRTSGGNPGGYIGFTDGIGALNAFMSAPTGFLGDYSILGFDARFEFDARTEAGTGQLPETTLEGPGGVAFFNVTTLVVLGNWQHFSIPISQDQWQMISGTWADLMTNVTALRLNLDIVAGGPLDGNIDNFTLVGFPTRLTVKVSQIDVCWNSQTNATYQLQFRSDLTLNTWMNLGDPVMGNGTTNCISDPVNDQARRFYRVISLK